MTSELRKELEKLVLPQLPMPLSVPKEFAIKCAERAKDNIDKVQAVIQELFIKRLEKLRKQYTTSKEVSVIDDIIKLIKCP